MNWRTLTVIALTGIAAAACKSPFKRTGQADSAAAPRADSAAADTVAAAPAPALAQPVQQAAPARPVPSVPQTVGTAADEPWTPTYTGTVSPGMTRDEVIGVWGPPVAERAAGTRSYLYFRNGCEASCGTFDVVFLEGGQVVDAIVRGTGHTYSGTSSSPAGRPVGPTMRPPTDGTTG